MSFTYVFWFKNHLYSYSRRHMSWNMHVCTHSAGWAGTGRTRQYTVSAHMPLSKTVSDKLWTQASRTQGKPLSETALSKASKETSFTQGKQSKKTHTHEPKSSSRHRSWPNQSRPPLWPYAREGSGPGSLQTGWQNKEHTSIENIFYINNVIAKFML